MIEASGIDHIVLHVEDVRRSKDFYTGRLGMTVRADATNAERIRGKFAVQT